MRIVINKRGSCHRTVIACHGLWLSLVSFWQGGKPTFGHSARKLFKSLPLRQNLFFKLQSCGVGWGYYIYILTCSSQVEHPFYGLKLELCTRVLLFFSLCFFSNARTVEIEHGSDAILNTLPLLQYSEVAVRVVGIIIYILIEAIFQIPLDLERAWKSLCKE